MKTFLISIVYIRLIVGIYLKNTLNELRNIKTLSDYSIDSKSYKLIEDLKIKFKPLINEFFEDYKLEIMQEKGEKNINEIIYAKKKYIENKRKKLRKIIKRENENFEIENEIFERENADKKDEERKKLEREKYEREEGKIKKIEREKENIEKIIIKETLILNDLLESKKNIYDGRNLFTLYIKKNFETLKKMVNNINDLIGGNKLINFLEIHEDQEKYLNNFLKTANEFVSKYENGIFYDNLNIVNINEDIPKNIEEFFKIYFDELNIVIKEFTKTDIENWVRHEVAIKNVFKNKFSILQKMIGFEKNIAKKCSILKKEPKIILNFLYIMLNYNESNYKDLVKDDESREYDKKHYYETLVKKINLRLIDTNFIDIVLSRYELEEIARKADEIDFKRNNNLNVNSSEEFEFGIDFYKKGVKSFINKILEFHRNLDEEINYNDHTTIDYSRNIFIKVLESHLDITENFKENLDNAFKLILDDDSYGVMYLNRINKNVSLEKMENMEKIQENFEIINDIMKSMCFFTSNNNIHKINSKLVKILNDMKIEIYEYIFLLYDIFNSSDPYKLIQENFVNIFFLDIMSHIPDWFYYLLFDINLYNDNSDIFNMKNLNLCKITNYKYEYEYEYKYKYKYKYESESESESESDSESESESDSDFYFNFKITKMFLRKITNYQKIRFDDLSQNDEKNRKLKLILFNMIYIFANMIVEKNNIFLPELLSDNNIPKSFKNIHNLCNQFINETSYIFTDQDKKNILYFN